MRSRLSSTERVRAFLPMAASLPGSASRPETVETSFSPVRSFSSMTTAAPAFCSSMAL